MWPHSILTSIPPASISADLVVAIRRMPTGGWMPALPITFVSPLADRGDSRSQHLTRVDIAPPLHRVGSVNIPGPEGIP